MPADRCPRCDREDCQFHMWNAGYSGQGEPPDGYTYDGAETECRRNAVDWRTRCLAAESREKAAYRKGFEAAIGEVSTFPDVPDSVIDHLRASLARLEPGAAMVVSDDKEDA